MPTLGQLRFRRRGPPPRSRAREEIGGDGEGRLCHGDGGRGRGDRLGRAFRLPILQTLSTIIRFRPTYFPSFM